jgi:uncharacterized protein
VRNWSWLKEFRDKSIGAPNTCVRIGIWNAFSRGRLSLRQNTHGRGVAVYLLFTLVLSSVFYFLIARSGRVGGGWGAYIGCLMWCPGVAALLTCKYLGRDVSTLGWKWGRTRYEVACYLIPLGYGTAIYAVVWLTGLGGFYNKQFYQSFSKDFGLGPLSL